MCITGKLYGAALEWERVEERKQDYEFRRGFSDLPILHKQKIALLMNRKWHKKEKVK